MRRTITGGLFAVLLLAVSPQTAGAASVRVGDAMPAVDVSDWRGGGVDLTASHSQVMVIDFWASWCDPCRAALPELNAIAQRHAAAGLQVIAINIDKTRAPADAFLASYVPVPAMTLLRDPNGAALARYGAAGMPALYVVDRRGVVQLVESGFTAAKLRSVEALLVQLLDARAQP